MAEPENVRGFLTERGPLGPLIYVLSFGLLHPVGMPAFFFIIPAALVWPAGLAVALSVTGAVLAGTVAYAVAHGLGHGWIDEHMPERLRRATERARERPFRTTVLVRLVFFLFAPAHWALAISGVRLRPFLLGSIVGLTPMMVFYVVGGKAATLWMIEQEPAVWVGLAVALGLVWLGVRALRARRGPADPGEGAAG